MGSIPAHAGKPSHPNQPVTQPPVYPRPRGEAWIKIGMALQSGGLSPPTRGSHRRDARQRRRGGSIPAHAGKPGQTVRPTSRATVYPRPRGEAGPVMAGNLFLTGLSPPTRGSRPWLPPPPRARGSIPAHAGKPGRDSGGAGRAAVYPRPRGEASPYPTGGPVAHGLSPPTRGSPLTSRRHRAILRSIPAHAGKPLAF